MSRYCEGCGTKLKLTPGKQGFDNFTGHPTILRTRYKCPNFRWFNWWRHDWGIIFGDAINE